AGRALSQQGGGAGARLWPNGSLAPAVPFPNDPVIVTNGGTIETGDLRPYCGQVLALQLQNPDGRMSNEVPIAVASGPRNDVGPDRRVCVGAPVTIGTPAVPGLAYAWSPPAAFADPSLAVQTFVPPTLGAHARTA